MTASGRTIFDDNSSFNSQRFLSESINDEGNKNEFYSSIEQVYDLKLRTAGGFGHFQRLATLIIVVGYALMGSVNQGLLFFLQYP